MAITLPKYKKQVPTSPGSVNVTGSVRGAGAEWGAISQVSEQVGDIAYRFGKDYKARQEASEQTAHLSDFKLSVNDLKTNIELASSDHLNSGGSYAETHSKVVGPMVEEFEQGLRNKGYSEAVIGRVATEWGHDKQKIISESVLGIEKRKNADLLIRNEEGYKNAIKAGDPEDAEMFLAQVRNVAGEGKALALEKEGLYDFNILALNQSASPEEINQVLESDSVKKMDPAQYASFKVKADSAVRKITADEIAPIKKDFARLFGKDELTTEMIEASNLPEQEKSFYTKLVMDDTLRDIAANQREYDNFTEKIDTFLSGKYKGKSDAEYTELLDDMKEAKLPANVINDLMLPITDGMGDRAVNAPFYTGKKKRSVYDQGVARVMNQYRDSYSSANVGLTATEKLEGFGQGYASVYQWVRENKDKFSDKKAVDAAVREAMQPVISNRLDIESKKKALNILEQRGVKTKPKQQMTDEEKIKSIWERI